MKTAIFHCPNCGRLYTDEDYCLDCSHTDDGCDPVELAEIGEFDAVALLVKAESAAMRNFPPNIQPFADGLAAHGFRLSRGTWTSDGINEEPTWNIDRFDDPTFLPVWDISYAGEDAMWIVALIGRAFAKWEAAQ
jgi:hypothetical protein